MKVFTIVTALSLSSASWAFPQSQRSRANFTVGQIVETSSGPVVGHAAPTAPEVSEYLGIPYAQAPMGDLRFAAPVKFTGSSLLNGSNFGSTCLTLPSTGSSPTAAEVAAANLTEVGLEFLAVTTSPDVVYSEDCLYLNVWTKPQSGESQKAVMVFIYGGDFQGGSSSIGVYNGAVLADQKDVIVINFNYRLSILGFPGNPTAQDNLAFLDQRLAIEWVRDNIANFGGDPARITLFGQSAGSSSTDFYSYAWACDPIIAGMILESGTIDSFTLPYAANDSAAFWYDVTTAVGCGNASTDSTTLLACMRSVDADSIMAAVPRSGINAAQSAFGPTVDESIVFSNYSNRTPARIPVVVGNDNYESGLFRTEFALFGEAFPDSTWDMYQLSGYTCPSSLRANYSIAANNPTWRYRWFAVFPDIDISSEAGAYHGIELPLIFGTTDLFSTVDATADEIIFTAYVRGAWAAFAKDPVNGLTAYGWPLYDPAQETLIRLGFDNSTGLNLAFPILYDAGCANATSLLDLEISLLG